MNVNHLVSQAFQALRQGDNENALRFYQEALSVDPQCLPALRGVASVYAEMGDFKAAIDGFTLAIGVNPNDAASFSFRSIIYANTNNFEKALVDANRAIELEPEEVGHYRNKASALLELKSYFEALQCFKQILQLEPQDKKALEAVGILSDAVMNERLLPPLEDLANKIDEAFQPFDDDRGILDEERKNSLREIIVPISDKSTELVKDIPTKDTTLEVLLVYSYIQGVSRGCGAIRLYGVDAGKERLDESKKFFKQSLSLAEKLEDSQMMKRIHLKLGAIMLSLCKTWEAKECISDAFNSYKWLSSHKDILSKDEEKLLSIRLLSIYDIVESIKNPSSSRMDEDNIDSDDDEMDVDTDDSFGFRSSDSDNYGKQISLGVGTLGIIVLLAGQWLIGLALIGYAWYSWQSH